MRDEPRGAASLPNGKPKYSESKLSWWQNLRFKIWCFFNQK